MKKNDLKISGMTCASCAALLEKNLNKAKGVSANVNIATEKASLEYNEKETSLKEIEKIIQDSGFSLVEEKDQIKEKSDFYKKLRNNFLYSLILGIPLFYLAMGSMIGLPKLGISLKLNILIQFLITTAIMVVNSKIYISGLKKLIKRSPNMDSLVEIGTLAAYFYSLAIFIWLWLYPQEISNTHVYFESAGFILIFISLGKFLEAKTKGKAGQAIQKLIGIQPKNAAVIKEEKEVQIPIEDVEAGDIMIVRPGEKIPVDSVIVKGTSTIDESSITGESIPVAKKEKDKVIGGTINKTGLIRIKAEKVGSDMVLSQIIKIVNKAIGSKAPIQLLADKVSFYFVPAVIGIAMITLFIWLIAGYGFPFALTAFVSVLIIACPCSLGLATPTAVMMGTGIAANKGILIKTSKALEIAHKIDTIVFDKTGTLTSGKPQVKEVKTFDFPKEKVIKVAFSLAKNSNHPISYSINGFAQKKRIKPVEIDDFREIEGKGIQGRCLRHKTGLLLGNEKLMRQKKIEISKEVEKAAEKYSKNGRTPLFVSHGKKIVGLFAIMDDVRQDCAQTMMKLKKMGKNIIMISGDKKEISEAIAQKIKIDKVFSQVMPQDKSTIVKQLQQKGKKVAMVGDGINDAPALAQSDLGIAFGSGTDIALETGEIILLKNDLDDVLKAIKISQYTFKKIKQNLFWAFFYNSVGIPIAAGLLYPFFGFLLNPMIAAIAMSFSSISVVGNSLLMKFKNFD